MKKVEIIIRPHLMIVKVGSEYATMRRNPDKNGLRKISFTCPVYASNADMIEESGIAQVESINLENCTITFRALPFYETHLMSELITDIIQKNEKKAAQENEEEGQEYRG